MGMCKCTYSTYLLWPYLRPSTTCTYLDVPSALAGPVAHTPAHPHNPPHRTGPLDLGLTANLALFKARSSDLSFKDSRGTSHPHSLCSNGKAQERHQPPTPSYQRVPISLQLKRDPKDSSEHLLPSPPPLSTGLGRVKALPCERKSEKFEHENAHPLAHMHMLVDMASSPQYLAPSAQSPDHLDIDPRITGLPDGSCPGIAPSTVAYSTSEQASYSEVRTHLSCTLYTSL